MLRVITFALWQAWSTSMVVFLHLQGKRTENYSSIFWQNPLLSPLLWFFRGLHCETQYSNTGLLAVGSAWPLSPAARRIQEQHEKFLYQSPSSGEEIISCFSSGLDNLIDQVKTWHHPCLTSSSHRGGVILLFFQQRSPSHKGQLKNLSSKGKAQFLSQTSQSK